MKYYRLYVVGVVLALAIAGMAGCIVSPGFPTKPFPAQGTGLNPVHGQGEAAFQMFQGWFEGQPVWYICWGSNVLRFRGDSEVLDPPEFTFPNPNPVPKLGSAIGNGAAPIYFVTNFQQGPIFSTIPRNASYSGLWQVFNITWNRGVTPRPICSTANLPSPAEATITPTNIVIDCPIVAVGPLGGPWTPAPPGSYRIPQAIDVDIYNKIIVLPTWVTFGVDPVTKTIVQTDVALPDACDPQLATILGANFAPALKNVPLSDTQRIWIFDWTQNPAPPPGQLPVMENILKPGPGVNGYNINYAYSPIMQVLLTRRTTLPPMVFNNPALIQQCIAKGGLQVIDSSMCLNVLLIDYTKWTNGSGSIILGNH